MARVQAVLSKNGSKVAGYYNHQRVLVGEVFEMKEVNEEGYYLDLEDPSGKKLALFDKDGKPSKDGKGKPKKCQWVAKEGSLKQKKLDPKAVAAVVSGKNPGAPGPVSKAE